MSIIALEFVPPNAADGADRARAEATRAREGMRKTGIADRVNALLIPGMIPEESDRPVPLEEKLDPLEVRRQTAEILPLECIVTQVTAFSSMEALGERLGALGAAGIRRVVFVGVPRTLADGEGPGVPPTEALDRFRAEVPHRGVILIPTRLDEKPRFEAKLRAGANFALTQMLFSDCIADLLPTLELGDERPEILLSFGYVPKAEARVGLIRWLIRDGTDAARREMDWVAEICEQPFARKRDALVEVYKRATDRARESGLPLGVHFECPYGFSPYAFEVFGAMLEHWTPGTG